ncbi:hypothetical protein MMC12_002122 [Toensbergia leucococca]|nr:hypothetical protein [Toensbergia leucococca]
MSRNHLHEDIELGRVTDARRCDGYPSLANFISQDSDAAIYRRFERLSARSLLYLQSELHDLEEQLENCDREDASKDADVAARKSARSWDHLTSNAKTRTREADRLKLIRKIKAILKEYHEFLVLQSQVYALEGPGKRTLAAFRRWFSPAVQGKVIPVLGGRDKDLLDDRKDLVALAPMDEDRLNRFLQDYFGWFFRVCDQSPDKTIENLWKTDDRPHGL